MVFKCFIALFGYPYYILTQCGIYLSTFLFIQATITLIIKLYKTISINYNLKQVITVFSSIAHGFFTNIIAEMVNDLTDTYRKKPKLAFQTSKFLTHMTDNPLDDFSDNQRNSIIKPTGITSSPSFCTKRSNRPNMTRFKLFPKRKQFNQPITNH